MEQLLVLAEIAVWGDFLLGAVVFGVDTGVFGLENAEVSTILFPFCSDVGARCSAPVLGRYGVVGTCFFDGVLGSTEIETRRE